MWYALGTLSRWLVFGGLLTALGVIAFRGLVLVRAGDGTLDDVPLARARVARIAAGFGMLAARLILLGALARLAAELAVFRDPLQPLVGELSSLLVGTAWGRAWVAQAGFGAIALLAFWLARREPTSTAGLGWILATVSLGVLAMTPAFSGHAAASETLRSAAIGADAVHVVAGGTWLGTLVVIAAVSTSARRSGQPVPAGQLVGWLGAFAPLALTSAALITGTGVFAAWVHLDQLSSLWTSAWGRFLILKLALLGVIFACGAYNWKRSEADVAASEGPAKMPRTVAIELATGVALLLVTALLVTTPVPNGG